MKSKITPVFCENYVAIVFASNQEFAPVLSVMLQSVIENTNDQHNYDIIILTCDIDKIYQEKIRSMAGRKENISIRIVNVAKNFENYNLYVENRPDITAETYFRLIVPFIMNNYYKAIYLDGDMVANCDLYELGQIDIDGYLLAAATDCDSVGVYHRKSNLELNDYRDNILKLEKPDEYFCAGMLVMNLQMFREQYTEQGLLEFATSYQWRQHDQDVLNVLGQNKTKIVPVEWNLLRDAGNNKYMPEKLYNEFLMAEKAPKIIHYGGRRKPWIFFDVERGEFFWKYAGWTPFYKEILSMVNSSNKLRYSKMPQSNANISLSDSKETVLKDFSEGKIGFAYIKKYFFAWLNFKIRRKKK